MDISLPLTDGTIFSLPCGTIITVSGTLYTARDQAHKKICAALNSGEPLPFPLKDNAIYYCGPAPANGQIIGSCGPTTSARMDAFTPALLKAGLSVMIGKGARGNAVLEEMKRRRAVYLCAAGGSAALIRRQVTDCKLIAYPELDCEAVYKLTVKELELIIAIDAQGNSVFQGT